MKIKTYISIILLIFFTGAYSVDLLSQVSGSRPGRQSAMEAFSKGDYEKAYSEFSELLKVYSKDPLYKYYAALSLIKLERDPDNAVKLLEQAIELNTAVRPLPEDTYFYLARARHLAGDYQAAAGDYNRFADIAGRKAARELGVQELIQQCSRETGALDRETEIKDTVPEPVKKAEVIQSQKPLGEPPYEAVKEPAEPEAAMLPYEFSSLLDQALALQYAADSLTSLVQSLKEEMEKHAEENKNSLRAKISEYETLAGNYQKAADKKFEEARKEMNPEYPETEEYVETSEIAGQEQVSDKVAPDNEPAVASADTTEVFSYFRIVDKKNGDQRSVIEIDPDVPEGLIYRIQIAVFRNPVSPVFFKGITPVYGFRNENSELKTYYAGMFRRLADARSVLPEVKAKGFKDSFITSFLGRKQISSDRAVMLEKEWGTRPFERLVNEMPVIVPADTLPPTLIFRVEVMRLAKPAKDDVVEALTILAGSRGLDIITMEDKKIAYIIGNFITFESATEYADLIVRNGYRDASVVAWLGKREIPVDTAKQLFDNLK